jgi:hypothetical protein
MGECPPSHEGHGHLVGSGNRSRRCGPPRKRDYAGHGQPGNSHGDDHAAVKPSIDESIPACQPLLTLSRRKRGMQATHQQISNKRAEPRIRGIITMGNGARPHALVLNPPCGDRGRYVRRTPCSNSAGDRKAARRTQDAGHASQRRKATGGTGESWQILPAPCKQRWQSSWWLSIPSCVLEVGVPSPTSRIAATSRDRRCLPAHLGLRRSQGSFGLRISVQFRRAYKG